MIRVTCVWALALGMLLPLVATARPAGPPQTAHVAAPRDLAEIRASHVLRVLVNQSRNSSAQVKGQAIGVEYARLMAFEQHLNRHAGKTGGVRLKIIPKSKEQLFAALRHGEGDLVAPGELMSTQGADKLFASASSPDDAPLVPVGKKGARHLNRLEQLSGRTVALASGSAAGEAIQALNQRLIAQQHEPVKIEWVDPSLAVEDVLEMVQGGIFPLTVVERPIAERWLKVMPKLRIDTRAALPNSRAMHWYVRRNAPQLQADMSDFLAGYRATADHDKAFKRVYGQAYQVHYPLSRSDRQRLEQLRPLLQRNAREQRMDWLDLAALAFKESSLNPQARGGGAATGLMQMSPAAGRRVGVGDVHRLDNNVQASARYLALIRQKFFASNQLNERERMAFVLAAYNMGPERVQALRAEARRRGLNPNQWFFQVERVAMEQVGVGAVSFVNSVNKYYLAFDRARDSLEPAARKWAVR
jgi:membrane-bound lytic murein transglycosylase MltF